VFDKRLLNIRSPFDGRYTIVQSTDNAGISLRWFRDVFGDAVLADAQKAGLGIYPYFDRLAQAAPAGAGGLLYLPYLAGEKAPIWDPRARGVFFGMGLGTGYGEFVRAVMEGVAFSLRECMELMPNASDRTSPIPIGGGVANSQVWCQILADVLDRTVIQLRSNETETLGDVIIAAQGIGLTQIPPSFGKQLAKSGRLLAPNPAVTALYDEQFARYKKLYRQLKELF
jgi:xylulokinase